MKKETMRNIIVAILFFVCFVVWTFLVQCVDVSAIGPKGSSVGFATINGYFHSLTGVNFRLYNITDWLGLVPIAVATYFAFLGLYQYIRRKNILKVDFSILALGVFYIVTICAYIFFEAYVVNYRPVLINEYLEASYPSSTTLLVMCVMPTAIMQFNFRIKNKLLQIATSTLMCVFIAFMVIGRTLCGVHWLSDIVGGVLFSACVVTLYYAVCKPHLTYK